MIESVSSISQAGTRRRKRTPQPLHVVQIAEALLSLQALRDLSGLGKTTLHARIRAGDLEVVRIGKRCTRVRGSEAQRFLQSLGKAVSA